jgi:hypothetical protein
VFEMGTGVPRLYDRQYGSVNVLFIKFLVFD